MFAAKDAFYVIARNIFTVGAVAILSGESSNISLHSLLNLASFWYNHIPDLALTIVKIFTCAIVTCGAYFFMAQVYSDDVSGSQIVISIYLYEHLYLWLIFFFFLQMHDLIGPTVLVLAVSWMTVTMFTDVFHMCIDTVLMCYITDMEDNNGTAIYADSSLQEFLRKHGKLGNRKTHGWFIYES